MIPRTLYDSDHDMFRDSVRKFLQAEAVPHHDQWEKDGMVSDEIWLKAGEQGFLCPTVPEEYGGVGVDFRYNCIVNEEIGHAGCTGLGWTLHSDIAVPYIVRYGSEEQKQRFLPDILESNVWWCQGYSEPNAGSDLASLKTMAVRDGDDYVVNGNKTWNTYGQYADWIFCLVRTDNSVKKQEGISFLLIDMKSPGITLKPIVLLDGHAEVNEVFFDDVRVPAANLIGEENKGWTYAKVLLTHERTNIAGVPRGKRRLASLKRIAAETDDGFGGTMANNADFKAQLAEVEIELQALEYAELRTLAALSVGKAPGPESSILKIVGTELAQKMDEMTVELAGYNCLPFVPEQFEEGFEGEQMGPGSSAAAALSYFNNRKLSIFGGSNEVQRNIISKAVLGL